MNHDSAETLATEFLQLLDAEEDEQTYQTFLEEHLELIPHEFVKNHGVHFDLVLRKLSLAKDFTTDFFYMSKSSADWNLVLVEIEKPQSKYFKIGTNDFHGDFLRGLDQIRRWRAWFSNEAQRRGFENGTLGPIRTPLRENPCKIKYVLVHGRRREFSGSEQRRALIRSEERDDFQVLSFDSLVESLHTKSPRYLGVRRNEKLRILSSTFISEDIFTWIDTSHLEITKTLRNDIVSNSARWRTRSPSGGWRMDEVLKDLSVY